MMAELSEATVILPTRPWRRCWKMAGRQASELADKQIIHFSEKAVLERIAQLETQNE